MGEGRPFIPPAELGGILADFNKGGLEGFQGYSLRILKLFVLPAAVIFSPRTDT